MASYVPKRSVTGCLTCKQRKKKCDETKPVCRRCSKGGFPCLGYNQSDGADGILDLSHDGKIIGKVASTHPMSQDVTRGLPATTSRVLLPSPGFSMQSHQNNTTHSTIAVSGNLQFAPEDAFIQEMVPLIMRHYKDLVKHILFNPLAMAIEKGLQWRFNSSKSIRWAMYIGARVTEAMSNGGDGQRYMSWVIRFYQHVMASSTSADLDMKELDARFAVIHDLSIWVFTVLGTSKGYLLFRDSSSFFLKLAALFPQVWSDNGTVSISEVVQIEQYEMKNFILQDTLSALALGIPSVILYDVSEPWVEETPTPALELVYGLPAGIVLLLAKINSWRISRFVEHTDPSHSEWQLIEERLRDWSSDFDPTDQASNYINRIAVQECWRQAGLIYLYMGMCEVNSADPRVQSGVRQVVQLASTVREDSPLRVHLFIPCLIAGAAARKEKHRAVARSKIEMTRNAISMTLRGTDFIPVLDHLWHGSAAGGRPITWQDYIQSRCSVLPIVV